MTEPEHPRILFVDAYDSFSNNIISLIETSLNAEVTVIKIDNPIENFPVFLKAYAAVVAGPGPGDPRKAEDVGLFQKLWELEEPDLIPVLGICLGFQSLVLAHGGSIERLPEPRHGIIRKVISNRQSIFRDIPCLETVQYHSLHAILDPPKRSGTMKALERYLIAAPSRSDVIPLAWDCEVENWAKKQARVGERNPGRILMAVKHNRKPFYGIQFHPESISSSREARKVIANWWDETSLWRLARSKRLSTTVNGPRKCSLYAHEKSRRLLDPSKIDFNRMPLESKRQVRVDSKVVDLADLTVPKICEAVGSTLGDAIVFDSENYQGVETGAFSIIGLIEHDSLRFEYSVGSSEVHRICNDKASKISLSEHAGDVFVFLETFMQSHQAKHDQHTIPFWGGLMGYIAYEACLETLGTGKSVPSDRFQRRPDLSFVFVERSIVIDHLRQVVHIQSIKPGDHPWIISTSSLLSLSLNTTKCVSLPQQLNASISFPDEVQYKGRIRACQASIRAGDSYELCLTNQARIMTPSRLPSWPLYRRLRTVNPAPFAAYIRFGDLTVLSCSPERFMQWSRPSFVTTTAADSFGSSQAQTSILQFRPIKGTVARRPTPNLPLRSLSEATKMLSTEKERAENLMIVDLIRHDLHGVVGSGKVEVPKLMVVEEYETVFQLVTVVEGSMVVKSLNEDPSDEQHDNRKSNDGQPHVEHGSRGSLVNDITISRGSFPPKNNGVHRSDPNASPPKPSSPLSALPATLPPGSMTGAPKLRSCQILRSLETGPRGVYSGVIGYMDVGGAGDWSVAIRCAVRWDDSENATGDTWTVGAGGAVTALSTEEGEWAEMLAKLQATLRIFEDESVSHN